jgi:hypothetical protein
MRIFIAAVLGVCSFLLMFLLGEGVKVPPTVRAADYITGLIFIIGMGGYFLVAMYLLSRGIPKGSRKGWVILALNATLLLTSVIALIVEPNKLAALLTLGTAVFAVACSCAGSALAARRAGPRSHERHTLGG